MKLTQAGVRIYLACVTIFIAGLTACSRISPTQDIRTTELTATETSLLAPTNVQNLNPIFGEQQRTLIARTPQPVLGRTSTPDPTATLFNTPTPTDTPIPTPIATAPIVWGAGDSLPIVMDQYRGQWLPLQQMMVGNNYESVNSASIYLSSGPRFTLDAVTSGSNQVLGSVFTTSPIGRWILFGSIAPEDYDHNGNEVSTITRYNLLDGRLQRLLSEFGSLRWISFPGWLDGNTVAVSDYAGSGFYNYTVIDVPNDAIISRVQVHGFAYTPNPSYLPLTEENGGPYRLFVLARSIQSEPFDTLLGPNIYTRGFPNEYIAPDMNTIFKDWLPGTNRMLVQAFLYNRNTSSVIYSQLMLWSVDAGIVQVVVQAAIDGKFSPDGRQLAFVTMGPAPLTPDGQPSFDLGPQIPQTNQSFLQLMDLNTRRVFFSLPIITALDRSKAYTLDVYNTPAVFSTDSRYIAFLTPGLLLTDQTGKLVVLPVNQESAPYLSVLDLSSFQALLSTPLYSSKDFYFSPDSDRLIFLGKEGNWYIMALSTNQVLPLTLGGGERLLWNGWSYDGLYFSFFEPMDSRIGKTYVFGPLP